MQPTATDFICIDGQLFHVTGRLCTQVPRCMPDGIIKTFVPSDALPITTHTANFGAQYGCLSYMRLEDGSLILQCGADWFFCSTEDAPSNLTLDGSYIYSFSAVNPPVAACAPGDIVTFRTLDCYNGQITSAKQFSSDFVGHPNPATGPLFIEGAEPGDALRVEILSVETAECGICCTCRNCGVMWPNSELRTKVIPVRNGYALFNDTRWPVNPMVGVIGTAPAEGSVSTGDSFSCGGNMDSPILTAGATVYFPVQVPGALLAMGDIHATMGEGEACGTGIEIAGAVTVRVSLVKNAQLRWPVTETADAWYVNTNGRTADEAITRGYLELQRLIQDAYGWDSTDANMYISLQGLLSANQACLGTHELDLEGPTFRVGCKKAAGKPALIG